MSQLNQLVGGLLEQLAQARAESDQYTASLSQQYLEDPLLQYFPVPRLEMGPLNLRMKVAVLGETFKPDVVQSFLENQGRLLVQAWLAQFQLSLEPYQSQDPATWEALMGGIKEESFQTQVQTSLTFLYRGNFPQLIQETHLIDLNAAYELLLPALTQWYLSQNLLHQLLGEDQTALYEITLAMESCTQTHLLDLQNELIGLAQSPENISPQFDLNADRLKELPEAVLTEFVLHANVQNYQWTHETQPDSEEEISHLLPV